MADTFESWAVVEQMGHAVLAGRVTEEERFGGKVGRVDVPAEDGSFTTVYFTSASLYRLTACSEEVARAKARVNQPKPVYAYELPRPALEAPATAGRYDRAHADPEDVRDDDLFDDEDDDID